MTTSALKKMTLIAVAAAALLAGCGDGPSGPLSAEESQAVVRMREEEKMARDVYTTLSPQDAVFSNIAESEQKHMDAVANLLDNHDLEDPAAGKPAGIFQSQELQALHDQLVARGSQSRVEALAVGVEIEELDLRDLNTHLAQASAQDVRNVFGNLARGSRNHLRSFHGKLTQAGGSYAPKYLDAATFNEIVSSPTESGN